uniref:hypothetical protein n=1 Tax=Parafrankia elaeagni TaxID=222534 RepID=UPI0012B63F23|nr:hypothetical protein [Parafrankia elaeagni]
MTSAATSSGACHSRSVGMASTSRPAGRAWRGPDWPMRTSSRQGPYQTSSRPVGASAESAASARPAGRAKASSICRYSWASIRGVRRAASSSVSPIRVRRVIGPRPAIARRIVSTVTKPCRSASTIRVRACSRSPDHSAMSTTERAGTVRGGSRVRWMSAPDSREERRKTTPGIGAHRRSGGISTVTTSWS